MILQTFKRRKKISFLLIAVITCFNRPIHADEYDDEDNASQSDDNNLAPNLNCFSLVDEDSWHRVLTLDKERGILRVHLNNTGTNVIECLQDRLNVRPDIFYSVSVWRQKGQNLKFEEKFLNLKEWIQPMNKDRKGIDSTESKNPNVDPEFHYILLEGQYRVRFLSCTSNNRSFVESFPDEDDLVCDVENEVSTDPIRVDETSPLVNDDSWCLTSDPDKNQVHSETPKVEMMSLTFRFRYRPCIGLGDLGERVTVSLHLVPENQFNGTSRSCFGSGKVLKMTMDIDQQFDANLSTSMSHIFFKTPSLPGEHYYCLSVTSDHLVCRDIEHPSPSNATLPTSDQDEAQTLPPIRHAHSRAAHHRQKPNFCQFHSEIVHVPSRPWIGAWIPLCNTHFACGWIYIVAVGLAILITSCILSAVCLYCCCKSKPRPYKTHHHIPADDQHTFDTLCLADIKPKKTWVEIHEEFYREPPKNPGKILLLYSPDSKLFKDLQQSFRSFLELACHCVVLDLFDEELFQTIAYDPEAWLYNLLQDDKFKIVVICSENAFKRQQALLKGEVLNIPDVNSSLDGLFSAGLKFIQSQHAYDYHRLALVRYEMLALTAPEFKLQDMVPNREFLVPTQLHDLFCWIHDHDPLDLLGKPWDRYHLELQLLQDALKQARLDRRY